MSNKNETPKKVKEDPRVKMARLARISELQRTIGHLKQKAVVLEEEIEVIKEEYAFKRKYPEILEPKRGWEKEKAFEGILKKGLDIQRNRALVDNRIEIDQLNAMIKTLKPNLEALKNPVEAKPKSKDYIG